MEHRDLVAVVIAGGSGTRFWPLSTAQRPKQFLALFGERTLLQATVDRLRGLVPPERTLVVTAARFASTVQGQLPHIPGRNIIGEPEGRDTAAAIALAAVISRRRFGDAVMVVLPADHVVEPVYEFHGAVLSAAAGARGTGRLYTFGIPPAYPATAYGYLQAGEPVPQPATAGNGRPLRHYRVERFREKPPREVAEVYVRAGNHFWNSGMFVGSVETWLGAVERHLPEHARWLLPLEAHVDTPEFEARLAEAFRRVPKISVDYGIMEKADGVYMVEAPFRWSDVGGWKALADFLVPDLSGNAVRGVVHTLDARDNVVFCEDSSELVALVGVEGLIVARAGGKTLIAHKDRAEDVKKLVEAMENREKAGRNGGGRDGWGGADGGHRHPHVLQSL